MARLISLRKFRQLLTAQNVAVWTLLLLGLVLRLRQYLTGRSLWADEAMLALNIVQRDFWGLLQPLDYNQGAPLGFLLVEKALVVLLANHELVLRLFPLLAGILSMGLFAALLRRITGGTGLLAALALFVIAPRLVYYSSEVKQYMVDVAVTVGLLLLADRVFQGKAVKREYLWLGLAGAFGMWFSHPALFVLAGIGLSLCISSMMERDRTKLVSILGVGIAWVVNLAILYFFSWQRLSRNDYLLDYWDEYFIPMPFWGQTDWVSSIFTDWMQAQAGIDAPVWMAAVLLLIGFVSLAERQRAFAGAVLGSFVMAMAASGLKLYPLAGRLSLFLVPLLLILLGKAVETIQQAFGGQKLTGWVAGLLVGAFFLYAPAVKSVEQFLQPKYFEHVRPSMDYLASKWREGDGVYVSPGAVAAFRYYAPHYKLGMVPYEAGTEDGYEDPQILLDGLEPLKGNHRVWVLISHVYEQGDFNEKDFLLAYLDSVGEKEREFRVPDTSVFLYLYDLSP